MYFIGGIIESTSTTNHSLNRSDGMAKELKTGWVVIATSGSVVHGDADGRTIERQWLEDMAEVYDPTVFTARIYPEHRRYMGAFGKVLALKAEEATHPELQGEIQLLAIIAPNDNLIYANKNGDYTFPSIEVGLNYRSQGKFFLQALGVTDDQASAGVTELKFSKSDKTKVFSGEQLDFSKLELTEIEGDTTSKGIAKIFNRLRGKSNDNDSQDNEMKDEQFNQLIDVLKSVKDSSDEMSTQFSTFIKKPETKKAGDTPTGDSEEKAFATRTEFNALDAKLTEMTTKFSKLANEEKRGTDIDGVGGDVDDVRYV